MDISTEIVLDTSKRWPLNANFSRSERPEFIAKGPGTEASRRASTEARHNEATNAQLQEQLVAGQERERTRIAADLHDSIGSSLSAVKLGLEGTIARLRVEAPDFEVQPLTKMAAELKRTLEEVRRISMNLRPSILDDLGIVATIGWFCRELEGWHQGIRVEKQLGAQERDVPDSLKTTIFRILQEASNNTIKHAGANRIRITLSHDADQIQLIVEDNGKGFDILAGPPKSDGRQHCGLASMRQRARSTGGSLVIKSAPGAGTQIIAEWPSDTR